MLCKLSFYLATCLQLLQLKLRILQFLVESLNVFVIYAG